MRRGPTSYNSRVDYDRRDEGEPKGSPFAFVKGGNMMPLLVGLLATIIDTGSTNRPGLQITLDAGGHAQVQSRGTAPHAVQLDDRLCQNFIRALQSAAPLHALPAAHCMKSVSFGSRLFIELDGDRSPDLNCPVQSDAKTDALKKQALQILEAAKVTSRALRR